MNAPKTSPPVPAKKEDAKTGTSEWLKKLVQQEHDRVAEVEKFNQAAIPFLAALYKQILMDVESFRKEFPGTFVNHTIDKDQRFIEVVNHSRGGNPAPRVRISTNSGDQTLQLAFEFRPSLNKELPMGMANGKLVVELNRGLTVEALSQLALTPVLFPELTTNTLLYDSLTDGPALR